MQYFTLRIGSYVAFLASFYMAVASSVTLAQPAASNPFPHTSAENSKEILRFDFAAAPAVSVANIEELYAAVNNPANAGNQIVLAAGVYLLSAAAPGGAARPNGGRLELQENMSLRGVAGDRGAVVIDAINLPTSSYTTIANTGAIRTGKGTNAVEWLTIKNAVGGGAGIIAHLNAPGGAAFVRIAHCVSTGNPRGIDIRNVGNSPTGYFLEVELVDNDLYNNRSATATGLRIINTQGASNSVVSVYLSGNRLFDNQQGMLVENIGSTNGGRVSVYSSGDRFYENGGGAFVGGAFGPTNNSTVNFTAVGSVFENNNGPTDLFRGGLNVAGGASFMTANGGSNNTANVTLHNCRFGNNQVADLAVYGAASLPTSIGLSGTNNRARVRLYQTIVPNLVRANSSPESAGTTHLANMVRNSTLPSIDYDDDGRADISVRRPSNGTWYLNRSTSGQTAMTWGVESDTLVPADYDGDGKTDIAVWRPETGTWYVVSSSTGTFFARTWGQDSDVPAPADFDADGRADMTVFRPSTGLWYRINSSNQQFTVLPYGQNGDRPVVSDYDGDGRADLAVFRPSNATWYVQRTTAGYIVVPFGTNLSATVPADYDGDGRAEISVVNPITREWFYVDWNTGLSTVLKHPLYQDADIPVPMDYDGDSFTDFTVFRPSSSTWHIRDADGGTQQVQFGQTGDWPIPSNYVE